MPKLKKPESPRTFAKRIKHLSQDSIASVAVSALNRLLVDKGIVTELELQQTFLDEAERYGHLNDTTKS